MPDNISKYSNPRSGRYNRSMYNTVTGDIAPVSDFNSGDKQPNISEYSGMSMPLGGYGTSKYDANLSRQNIQYAPYFRAEDQGPISQLGNALNQAFVGEILGGTLEGLGYLGDVVQYKDLISGTEQEFGNWFSDIGKDLREWSQEVTPVYRNPEDQGKFQPWSWSYWMENMPSIASSISLMIPAAGVARGVGALAKLAKVSGELGKAVPAISGIAAAITSRHPESMMEAGGVYEQTFNEIYDKTRNFQQAKLAAAEAAARDYRMNWAMLVQDIPQYMLLGKFLSPKMSVAKSIGMAKALKQSIAPILAKQSYNVGWDMLGEGGEEAYQYIVGEESRRLANLLVDPESEKVNHRISQYLKDGEFWTNFTMGALGAGAMQLAGHIIGQTTGQSVEAKRLANLYSSAAMISMANKAYRFADNLQDQSGKDLSVINFTGALGYKGLSMDHIQDHKDFVDNLSKGKYSDEELVDMGVDPSQKNEIISRNKEVKDGLQFIQDRYDFYTGPENKFDSKLATTLAVSEYTYDAFSKKIGDYKRIIDTVETKLPRFGEMSLQGREMFKVMTEKQASDSRVSFLRKELEKEDLSDEEKRSIRNRLELEISKGKTFLDNHKALSKLRSSEDTIKDKEIEKGFITIDEEGKEIPSKDLQDYRKATLSYGYSELELEAQKTQIDFLRRKGTRQVEVDEEESISETGAELTEEGETEDILEFAEPAQEILDQEKELKKQQKTIKDEKADEISSADSYEDVISNEDNTNPIINNQLVEYLGDKQVKVKKNGKAGIVYKNAIGEYVIEYEDGNIEDIDTTKTLIEQDILSLDNLLISFAVDSYGINIEGKRYKFAGYNVRDAINSESTEVTLIKSGGKPVIFTNKNIVDELSYVINLYDVSRLSVLADNYQEHPEYPVAVKDPKDNKKYDVYYLFNKVNPELPGTWEVRHLNTNRIPSPRVINRVLDNLFQELDRLIHEPVENRGSSDIIGQKSPEEIIKQPDSEAFTPTGTVERRSKEEKSSAIKEGKELEEGIEDSISGRLAENVVANALPVLPIPEGYTPVEDPTEGKLEGIDESFIQKFPIDPIIIEEMSPMAMSMPYSYEDTELQKILIYEDPKEVISHVEFEIDYEGTTDKKGKNYVKEWWDKHPDVKVNKGLLSNMDAIDNIPIKANIIFKDGRKFLARINVTGYTKGKPRGEYHQIKIPKNITIMRESKEKRKAIQDLYDIYSKRVHETRVAILNFLINGRTPIADDIGVEGGVWNNNKKRLYRKLSDIVLLDKLEFSVVWKDGIAEDTDSKNIVAEGLGPNLTGSILFKVYTNRPGHGSNPWARTYFSKVSNEHADIIFNAFYTGLTKGFDQNVIDPTNGLLDNNVKFGKNLDKGLPAVRLLNTLLVWKNDGGPNPHVWGHDAIDSKYLATRGHILYYGANESIDFSKVLPNTEDFKLAKEKFIKHLTVNKNYAVIVKTLNTASKTNIKIGNFTWKTGETYKSFVVNNGLLKTNIEVDPRTDSYFATPIIHFNSLSIKEKIEDVKKEEEKIVTPSNEQEELDKINDILQGNRRIRKHRLVKEGQLRKPYTRMDTIKELRWFYDRFSNIPVTFVNNLIKITEEGATAFGAVKDASITLYERAEEGILFHEAFHVVFMYYLTDKQRASILRSAKITYNLDYSQLEEKLAEEFRQYVLSGKTYTPKSNRVLEFFRNLYDWIYTFFTGNTRLRSDDIERLFHTINKGGYKHARVKFSNREKYNGSTYFRRIEHLSSQDVRNITKQIVYKAIDLNNIVTAQDVSKLNFKVVREDFYNTLKELKGTVLSSDAAKALRDEKVVLFETILRNFDQFVDITEDFLQSINIRAKKMTGDTGDSVYEEGYEDEDDGLRVAKFEKATYEFDAVDNILANVKLFLATLPTGEINPVTGFPEFMDFRSAWSRLMYEVKDETDIYKMMDKLDKQASSNEAYRLLLYGVEDRDGNIIRPGLKNGPESLRTQFEVALSRYRVNFASLFLKKGTVYEVSATSHNKDVADTLKFWGESFLQSSMVSDTLFAIKDNDSREFIKSVIDLRERISREYNSNGNTLPNIDRYLDNLVDIINRLGFNIDRESILYLAKSNEKETLDTGFYGIIKGSWGVEQLIDFFNKNKGSKNQKLYLSDLRKNVFVAKLASAYVHVSPETLSNMILGPNNNPYYTYVLNSFLTDTTKKLQKDKYKKETDMLTLLERPLYNSNSYFIPQLKEVGRKFGLVTFSSFANKDYKSLSPLDDFLVKFHFNAEGYIPFPTLAGKGMYHFYEGLDKLDVSGITFKLNERGKYNLVFSDDILDVFEGYVNDEKLRIEQAKKDIEWAEREKNYDYLIENYHYKGTNSNGIPILRDDSGNFTGNATRYIHFPELNKKNYSREWLTTILKKRIRNTLTYAEKLGAVKVQYDDRGGLVGVSNILLGNNVVAAAKNKYKDNGIFYLIADFCLNGIVSTLETEKILSGDVAFYKDEVDKIKRMSSLIAPGESLREIYEKGPYVGKTRYKVASIKTYKHESSKIPKLLEDAFTENELNRARSQGKGLTEDQARDRAKTKLSIYSKKTDPADAQVFVTPHFYKEMVDRLGEWTNEMDEAFNLLMSDKSLSEEEEVKLLKLVMQPLKMVYYKMHFVGDARRLGIPVYDKMSMAALFPRVINKTALQPLYDKMIEKEIECVKFDSAVKAGNRRSIPYFNKDGTHNVQSLDNIATSMQHINGLKRQQVTDPKNAELIKLGTQVKKIVHQRAKDFGPLLGELSNRGREILLNKFTKDGKTLNFEKLYDVLRESAKLSGMSDDVVDNLVVEKDGKVRVNIDTFPNRRWIQSRIVSIMGKHVIDTKVPGNSYIQASAIGLHNPDLTVDNRLQLVDDKGRTEIKVSIDLYKYIIPNYEKQSFEDSRKWLMTNRDILEGVVYRIPSQGSNMIVPFVVKDVLPSYAASTVLVPYEFTTLTDSDFDIDKLYFMINNYNIVDGKLRKVDFVEADEEDKITSVEKLRILYQQNYGKRIKRLEKFRAIQEEARKDKVFVDRLGDIFDKFKDVEGDLREELDHITEIAEDWGLKNLKGYQLEAAIENLEKTIPTEEQYIKASIGGNVYRLNSKEGIQNRILEIFKEELISKKNYLENKISLGYITEELKSLSSSINELEGNVKPLEALELASPDYQATAKNIYITAKSGVAPFVLAQMHHSLSTGVGGLYFKNYLGVGNQTPNGGSDLSNDLGIDGESIFTWLSGLVSANVDAEKDPYIFNLNVNQDTWGVTSTLIRAGAGLSTFYFISQPVLKELFEMGRDNIRNRIKDLKKQYFDSLKDALRAESRNVNISDLLAEITDPQIFDINRLKKQYGVTGRDSNWYAYQFAVLNKFDDLRKVSWELTNSIQACSVDTKRYGNLFSAMRMYLEKYTKALASKELIGTGKLMRETFLETYKANSVDLTLDLFSQVTVDSSTLASDLFSLLAKENNLEYKSRAERDALVANIDDGIFYGIAGDYYRGLNVSFKDLFHNLGTEIRKLQLTKPNNFLLSELRTYRDISENYFLRLPYRTEKDPEYTGKIQDAWKDLLNSPVDKEREIGKKLIQYAFFTSGPGGTRYSIYKYVPVIEGLKEFDEFISTKLVDLNDSILVKEQLERYRKEFYLNNWDIMDILPRNRMESFDLGRQLTGEHNYVPMFYSTDWRLKLGLNSNGEVIFKPFVTYEHTLSGTTYLAEYVGNYILNEKTYPVYKTISKKGYKDPNSSHIIKEYGFDKSNFVENKLPYEPTEDAINDKFQNWLVEHKAKGVFHYVYPGDRFVDVFDRFAVPVEETPAVEEEEKVTEPEELRESVDAFNKRMFEEETESFSDPTQYTNHSGGAIGADSEWDNIGREFGIVNHVHYYHGQKTPLGNTEITKEQLEEGWQHVLQANKTLKRQPEAYKDLLSRNWFQVKNADAIFAIASSMDMTGPAGHRKLNVVEGGTGWAVQMAIDNKKPVHVFSQEFKSWYYFNYNNGEFESEVTPILTKNFAGIGTRKITDTGKQAIRNVYENTFKQIKSLQDKPPLMVPRYKIGRIYNVEGKEIFAGIINNEIYINIDLINEHSNKEIIDNQEPILNAILKNLKVYDRLVSLSKEQLIDFLVEHEQAHLDFERENKTFVTTDIEEAYVNEIALQKIGIFRLKTFDLTQTNIITEKLKEYLPTREKYIDDAVELTAKEMDNASVFLDSGGVYKGSLWGKKIENVSSMNAFYFLQTKEGFPKDKQELRKEISKDIYRNIPSYVAVKYWTNILKSLPDEVKAMFSNWAYYTNFKHYTSQYGKPFFDFNEIPYPELAKEGEEPYTKWTSFINGLLESFAGSGKDLFFPRYLLADYKEGIISWYKNLTPENLQKNLDNLSRVMAFKSMVVASFESGHNISALDWSARNTEDLLKAYYDIKQRNEIVPLGLQDKPSITERYKRALYLRYYNNFILNNKEYYIKDNKYYRDGANINPDTYRKEYQRFVDYQGSDFVAETYTTLYDAYKAGRIKEFEFKKILGEMIDLSEHEDLARLNKKVARFRKFIPGEVNIEFDESIPYRGTWDLKSRTLTFNPYLVDTGTVGHEYFHILFDIISESDPSLVREGLDQIKNSKYVIDIVDKEYSTYSGSDRDSELLAHAIEADIDKLFTKYDQASTFTRWLMRFFFKVKKLLGIHKSAVKHMAEIIVLSEEPILGRLPEKKRVTKYSKIHPEEKILEQLDNIDKLRRTQLNEIKDKAVETLQRRVKIYGRSGKSYAAVQNMQLMLDEFNKQDTPLLTLAKFVKQAFVDLNNAELDVNRMQFRDRNGDKDAFNARNLDRIRQSVSGYALLDEIADVIQNMRAGEVETTPGTTEFRMLRTIPRLLGKKNVDEVIELINKATRIRDRISTLYTQKGLDIISNFLAPYHSHMLIKLKDELEDEYIKLKKEKKVTQTLNEYIDQELGKVQNNGKTRRENLEEITKLNISKELMKASRDVNALQRWLESVYDSSDAIVTATIKKFEEINYKAEQKSRDIYVKISNALKELEKFQGANLVTGVNVRKFYDFMLEKDDEGNLTGHIVDQYKSEFWDEYNKVKEKAKEKAQKDNLPLEKVQLEIENAAKKFWRDNAPISKEDQKKISKELLDYVTQLRDQGIISAISYDLYLQEQEIRHLAQSGQYQFWEAVTPLKKYVEKLKMSEHSVSLIENWLRDNLHKYRQMNPKWLNKQYKDIQKLEENDPRRKFYELITSIKDEVEQGLPFMHRLHNKLPGIEKTGSERVSEGQGILKTVGKRIQEDLSLRPDEAERGDTRTRLELVNEEKEPIHYLPVYYTGDVKPEDQSYDLASIYYMYFRMAVDFKEKFEVLPELEMIRYFVNNRDYIKTDNNGKPYIDALDAERKRPSTESGKKSNLAQQFNDWFEAVIYGIKQKDEGRITLFPGVKIDFAKGINAMNSYTSLAMLGVNFIAGTANLMLGESMQAIEASAGEYMNTKDLAKANGIYTLNLPGILGDIGERIPSNIINVLNERFDTLNEYTNGTFRENSKFKRLMHSDALYFTMNCGEHAMQSTAMIGMLLHMPAKNSKGEVIGNIYEHLHVKDGLMAVDDEVKNFGEKEQVDFKIKLKRVLSSMHGEYYRNAQPAYQRLSLLRMAMMFRKFLVPGFNRRWGKLRPNDLKGTYTEGYYLTFGKFVVNMLKSLHAFKLAAGAETWSNLHEWEKANMKRMMTEMVFLVGAIALAAIFTKVDGDDDDDSWVANFMAYQALRMRAELSFYLLPTSAMQILRSPAAAVTMAQTLIDLFGDLTYPIYSGTFEFDRYEQGNYKGRLKMVKPVTSLIPGYKQYWRLLYIDDQLSSWNR